MGLMDRDTPWIHRPATKNSWAAATLQVNGCGVVRRIFDGFLST